MTDLEMMRQWQAGNAGKHGFPEPHLLSEDLDRCRRVSERLIKQGLLKPKVMWRNLYGDCWTFFYSAWVLKEK